MLPNIIGGMHLEILGLAASIATLITFGVWMKWHVAPRLCVNKARWEFLQLITSEVKNVSTTMSRDQMDQFRLKNIPGIVVWPFSIPLKKTTTIVEPAMSPSIIHRIHVRYLKHFQENGFKVIAVPFDLSMHNASEGQISEAEATKFASEYLSSLTKNENLHPRVFFESRIIRSSKYSKILVDYLYQVVGQLSSTHLNNLIKEKHKGKDSPSQISKEIVMGAITVTLADKYYRATVLTFGGEDERHLWENLIPSRKRAQVFHIFLPELRLHNSQLADISLTHEMLGDLRKLIESSSLNIKSKENPIRYILEHYFLICSQLTNTKITDSHGDTVPNIEELESWEPERIRELCLDLAGSMLGRVCKGKEFCKTSSHEEVSAK